MRDTLLKSSSSESEKSILRNMSLVWDLKSKWESNIYDLLKNMKTIPIKSMAFKKDHDLIEEDIFIFLLISLYVVIPNQMGMLYIIKNGIKMRKNFNKDKKSLLKYLEKTLSIGSEWKKLISRKEIDRYRINYDMELVSQNIREYMRDIEENYEFNLLKNLEFNIQNQNPLFGKKVNSDTFLRDLTIRYLDFLLLGIGISFKSEYEKHTYIYKILEYIFKKEIKEFDLMKNLEITDIKKYLNYDLHASKMKYKNILFEIFMIENFNFNNLYFFEDQFVYETKYGDNYTLYDYYSSPIYSFMRKWIDNQLSYSLFHEFYRANQYYFNMHP